MQGPLAKFIDLYSQDLAGRDMQIIDSVYGSDVEFIDAAHHVNGLDNLVSYFDNVMANVTHCRFEIHDIFEQDNAAAVSWTMHCAHPKLNGGKVYQVPGMSQLRFDDKITYHRDHFDFGAMIYEHIPLLGSIIRKIKGALNP